MKFAVVTHTKTKSDIAVFSRICPFDPDRNSNVAHDSHRLLPLHLGGGTLRLSAPSHETEVRDDEPLAAGGCDQ